MIVLDGPAVLLRIVVAVPADSGYDQFRVEAWIRSVCDEAWLPCTLQAHLDDELVALWVLSSHRPDDPGSVLSITEFIAAVGPDKPLIAALLDFHILCDEFLNTFANAEAVNCEQKLELAAVVLF